MHTLTNFDQTDRTRTLTRYDGTSPNEYLSDSDSYIDESDLGSDDYNNYESNYESDNEEASCAPTSTTVTPSYTLRQEKFNNDFTPKDLLNTIREIFLSPSRDISDEKRSLEYLPIYSFLFLNKKRPSLYNTYN